MMPKEKCDKRQAILEAALDLIAECGFHGAPTAMIAQRAQVGVGTIYRYFRDKDELIRELFQDLQARARALIFAEVPPELPVRDRFILVFGRLLRFFLESPREFRFMEQYYYSPFSADAAAEEENPVHRLLTEGREEGVIKDAPLPVLESIAYGPIVALAKEHGNRNLKVDEEMMRVTVEACWDALKNS